MLAAHFLIHPPGGFPGALGGAFRGVLHAAVDALRKIVGQGPTAAKIEFRRGLPIRFAAGDHHVAFGFQVDGRAAAAEDEAARVRAVALGDARHLHADIVRLARGQGQRRVDARGHVQENIALRGNVDSAALGRLQVQHRVPLHVGVQVAAQAAHI